MKSDFLKSFYNQLRQKFAKYKARRKLWITRKKITRRRYRKKRSKFVVKLVKRLGKMIYRKGRLGREDWEK